MNRIIIMALLCLITSTAYSQNQYELTSKVTMEGTKVGVSEKGTGRVVIPAAYDKIIGFTEGKCILINDNKVGYADTNGNIIIPVVHPDGTEFIDGRAFVFNGKKWAMIDEKGKLLTQYLYDKILSVSEGVARVVIANKIGYVNSSGVQILSCRFDNGFDCWHGLILTYAYGQDVLGTANVYGRSVDVRLEKGTPTIYNTKGVVVYKGVLGEKVEFTPDGHFTVINNAFNAPYQDCHKLMDNAGKVIIPYESRYYMKIEDRYISIMQKWKYGIMAFDGSIILKPNFHSITPFTIKKGELARVYFSPEKFFHVDRNFKCVEYDGIVCPE